MRNKNKARLIIFLIMLVVGSIIFLKYPQRKIIEMKLLQKLGK